MKKTILLLFSALLLNTGLIQAQTARLQVIHNCADQAASTVDVWLGVNGMAPTRLIDDFAFRTASSFIDAPAGVNLSVGIAPANSMSAADIIVNFPMTLSAGETYIAVANGILSTSGYDPAPAFGLDIYTGAREEAVTMGNTDVLVLHGSTDAPAVDVVEVAAGAGRIIDDMPYGGFEGYLELPTADYALQVRTAEGDVTVAEFAAPLATLGLTDASLVVLASGFLDPSQNSNGEAFGLYVALPAGGALVQLPTQPISTARVQVIHNAADLAADTVDVWLNDQLLLDNFAFRTASPFIDAPAGVDFDVTVQPANSMDTTNGLARFTYNLTGGEKYILVANGIVSGSGYSPAEPFDIKVFAGAMELSETSGNTSVLVFHGATDAPTVDVVETSVPAGTLADDLMYGDFAGYLDLGVADYSLDIRDMSGTTTVVSYTAPLQTLGLDNAAITVLASGFLDPSQNSNGPAFGLWVALASGGELVPLPLATAVETEMNGSIKAGPVPATNRITLFETASWGQIQHITLSDLSGRTFQPTYTRDYDRIQVDLHNFQTGIYFLQVTGENGTYTTKIRIDQ